MDYITKHVGASWASTTCPRAIWLRWRNVYDVKEEPPQLTSKGESICDIGRKSESLIVDTLRNKGFKVFTTPNEAEAYGLDISDMHLDPMGDPDEQFHIIHPDYPYISGYLDGIVLDLQGKRTILEIKTMACDKYYRCTDTGISKEFPAYFAQIQLYMYLTGIGKGMFAYAMRADDGTVDPSNPMFFNYEYVNRVPSKAMEIINRVDKIINSHKLPQKPPVLRNEIGRMILRPQKQNPCPSTCKYSTICALREINADNQWPVPTCRSCSAWWDCYRSLTRRGCLDDFRSVCIDYMPIEELLPASKRGGKYRELYDKDSGNTPLHVYLSLSSQPFPKNIGLCTSPYRRYKYD